MRKKNIGYIAVLMSLALTGLLSVQYYWTRRILRLNEEFVVTNIDAAMQQAVQKTVPVMDQLVGTAMSSPGEAEDFLLRQAPLIGGIINGEFEKRSLSSRIEWGIYSEYDSKLIYAAQSGHGVEILKTPYRYRLYAHYDVQVPFLIMIYLPEKLSKLLPHMWYLIVSSVLLWCLLIYTFVYTLFMLWRQKKLTELKSDLINHVTHEIKTPVTTIALVCESLHDPDMHYDREGLDKILDIIQHENKRLENLSRQIIEISQMEKGDYPLHKAEFSLHKAIDEAVNNTGFQVMHKSGRIVTHYGAENDTVWGDRTHIVHIVSNLIDNANKYCNEKPLIEVGTASVPGGLELTVKDNGIGIAKQNQKKIFEKLYRVPTGNLHNVKGFGLGLSYVKSIMERHGGSVTVESDINKGSVFRLFFPQ